MEIKMHMNYLDLFSGIGGFHEGLKQAGFIFEWVGFSEIDKYAKQIYKKHFPESEDLGDVKNIEVRTYQEKASRERNIFNTGDSRMFKCRNGEYVRRQYADSRQSEPAIQTTITTATGTFTINGRINLVTFGFPCQDLSIAGKQAGLAGKRSGLFSEAIRIIGNTNPNYFIFENVKGLFSSNQGRDFEYILRTIADIGYDGQWQLLNTRWVLPQNRERIYFVGYPANRCPGQIFPLRKGIKTNGETIYRQCVNTITASYGNLSGNSSKILQEVATGDNRASNKLAQTLIQVGQIGENDNMGQRVYSPEGIACSIRSEGGSQGAKTGLYCVGNKNPSGKGQSGNIYDSKGIAPSLCSGGKNPNRDRDIGYSNMNYLVNSKIRRLTPIECERLQGFEDKWTEGISDTQRYKCLGNAVTVPIVKLITEKLLIHIQKDLLEVK